MIKWLQNQFECLISSQNKSVDFVWFGGFFSLLCLCFKGHISLSNVFYRIYFITTAFALLVDFCMTNPWSSYWSLSKSLLVSPILEENPATLKLATPTTHLYSKNQSPMQCHTNAFSVFYSSSDYCCTGGCGREEDPSCQVSVVYRLISWTLTI